MITLSSDSEPEDILPPPPKRRSIEGVPRTFDNDSRKRFSFGASSILESPPPPPLAKAPPLFQKTPKTIRRRSVSMSCMTTSREEEGINRPPTSQVCSGFVKEAIEEEEEEEEEEETTSDLNLRALLSPEKKQNKNSRRGGKEKIEEVLNEFFGVYCLISRSDRPCYKNRCYIGYTVDPNRRIQQHNGGRLKGGAKKTDSRGPWDMVCVVHGFPNHVAALRFEWAWQNPGVTKALKGKVLKKERKETPFAYQLRIACELMNSETFCRFALTFRWLITTERIPFPSTCPPPSHIRIREGKVQKEMSKVPVKGEEYLEMGECRLCGDDIQKLWSLVRCISPKCHAHFHTKCLSEKGLKEGNEYNEHIYPLKGHCPICGHAYLWGDVIREQRRIIKISTKCAEEFREKVVRKEED